METCETKQKRLESNYQFLERYSLALASRYRNESTPEVSAAITIQKHYRAYIAKKVFSRLLADKLNQEEEAFFQRELQRVSESSLWLKRSDLKRRERDKCTVEENYKRKREQSAICIQRHWRRRRTQHLHVHVDLSEDFVHTLEENFPHICEQYSISPTGMVFQNRKNSFSTTNNSNGPPKIVRKIVPNNNNMSLFDELKISDSEYTLELPSEQTSSSSNLNQTSAELVDYNTPIPAKRPLVETSYVFEKELREDFDNPYFEDSDGDDDSICEEKAPIKLSSNQSLASRISEESLVSTTPVCDSGFEDDRGEGSKSSSPLPRSTHFNAWGVDREDDQYTTKKEIYMKPSTVQMCFVEEESDNDLDHLRNPAAAAIPDVPGLKSKRWSAVSQCHSESHITSQRTGELKREIHKRNNSYGGEELDMGKLKKSWQNSAHLMTVEQLANWLNIMQANFAKTNLELVEHLAERDDLQEQQDSLLQKIFALKSVNETGLQNQVSTQPTKPQPGLLSRRISSFFAKS